MYSCAQARWFRGLRWRSGLLRALEHSNADGKLAQEDAVGTMSCLIARLLCLLSLFTLRGEAVQLAEGVNPWVWRLCAEGHCAIYLLAYPQYISILES